MEIRYAVTEDDYIAYNLYHHAHSPATLGTQNIVRWGLPAVLIVIMLLSGSFRSPTVWAPAVVIVLAWIIIMPFMFNRSLKKNVRKLIHEGRRIPFTGEHKLILHNEYMRNEEEGLITETAYWRVEKIRRDDERLYIYIDSISSLIIPFRFFKDEAEKERFISLLENKTAGAVNAENAL